MTVSRDEVARAICCPRGCILSKATCIVREDNEVAEPMYESADAILALQSPAPSAPAGEVTDEMNRAGNAACMDECVNNQGVNAVYRAMRAAAPTPPAQDAGLREAAQPFVEIGQTYLEVGTNVIPDDASARYLGLEGIQAKHFRAIARAALVAHQPAGDELRPKADSPYWAKTDSPYRIGNSYVTRGGETVRFVGVGNAGSTYETMCDEAGVHRYTRRDFGRVTGTDGTDARDVPPPVISGERT